MDTNKHPWIGRALVLLTVAAMGPAATVHGKVEIVSSKDPDVRKHSDYSGIVIWLDPASANWPPAPTVKAQMIQQGKRFIPHVLAITVGSTVEFPNLDPIFHNAFSN